MFHTLNTLTHSHKHTHNTHFLSTLFITSAVVYCSVLCKSITNDTPCYLMPGVLLLKFLDKTHIEFTARTILFCVLASVVVCVARTPPLHILLPIGNLSRSLDSNLMFRLFDILTIVAAQRMKFYFDPPTVMLFSSFQRRISFHFSTIDIEQKNYANNREKVAAAT